MARRTGFTLLELMIVLAIVGLLAGWGIPSYREHMARIHRASAVSALYRAAQYLETLDVGLPRAVPEALTHAPPDGRPSIGSRYASHHRATLLRQATN